MVEEHGNIDIRLVTDETDGRDSFYVADDVEEICLSEKYHIRYGLPKKEKVICIF